MAIALLGILCWVQTTDWTAFRGPTGDGIAPDGAQPPTEWSETRNVTWKTPVPGRGRSSPVVLGGRVFVTTALEEGLERRKVGPDDLQFARRVDLGAVCLDGRTGTLLWQARLRSVEGPDPVHWLNSWATPTPAVEPGRLHCDFGGYGTWCLDPETGKILWERRLPLDHQVGPGSSPALSEGLLFLIRDGRDAQYVTALDARTGETIWKTDRPPIQVTSPNLKKSFSTPLLVESGAQRQLIAVAPHWAVAYEPSTGREIWRLRHGDGFSIGTAPVSGNGLLYLGTGFGKANLLAVRPDGAGDVTATHLVWRIQKAVPG
ncbi:MAG TPA: PQQ-binding-like beta-propeller repeat protein, partial [Planctomycetota bacterium]|nr:PQQ-binding-like beta-propeller repeat protein [Planctomycetota bacterium]